MTSKIVSRIPALSDEERSQLRENCYRILERSAAERQREAEAILAALHEYELSRESQRILDLFKMSAEDRIVLAFQKEAMSPTEEKLVRVLLRNPGSSSQRLTRELGWEAQAWHMHFGVMCRNRRHLLWPGPRAEERDAEFYTGILATFDAATKGFTMKPEAVAAFKRLGIQA